jgi:hypothetical protein
MSMKLLIQTWTPAFTGNCSCVSNTSAIHGGRAGVTKFEDSVCISTALLAGPADAQCVVEQQL